MQTIQKRLKQKTEPFYEHQNLKTDIQPITDYILNRLKNAK